MCHFGNTVATGPECNAIVFIRKARKTYAVEVRKPQEVRLHMGHVRIWQNKNI